MADLVITAANVAKGTPSTTSTGTAGEAITQGQALYFNTDGKWWKAKANGTAVQAKVGGVALNAASAGQPVVVQTSGQITIGATMTKGVLYYASPTAAGGIAPFADLGAGNYTTVLGFALSTTIMVVAPIITGVTQ